MEINFSCLSRVSGASGVCKSIWEWFKVMGADLRSGLDVRKAGVGLAAAGRSAEVPRDAAVWRTEHRDNMDELSVCRRQVCVQQ